MAIGESKREVRITWIGFTVILAVIGSVIWYKGGSVHPYFYGASAFFAFFAAAAPMALLPLYRLWVKFAMKLAWLNTRLLLGIIFYFLITPIGLAVRIFSHDPMDRKFDKSAATYWRKKEHETGLERYEKPY